MSSRIVRSPFILRNYARFFRATFAVVCLVLVSVVVAAIPEATRLRLVFLVIIGLVLLIPLYTRSGDVFSPAGFLGLAYLMGWFGPVLDFVINGDPDGLLLGNGLEYLTYPLLLTVVGMGCLVAGMYSIRGDVIANRLPRFRDGWNEDRANHVVLLFTLLGGASFALLMYTTGGIPTELAELSSKRRPPTAYIRWGARLLLVAALIDLGTLVNKDTRSGLRVARTVALVGIACFVPFYSSVRSTLFLFLISLLIVLHYRVIEFTFVRVLPFVLIGILTSNIMIGLRRLSRMGPEGFGVGAILKPTAIVSFFEAQTTGITVMAHLVHKVPGQLGFQFGQTLFTWAVFPIPRAFWSGKPVNLGQVLGEEIYKQGIGFVGAGTPPPVPAELYLNFWIPGLVIGMYALGVLVRAGYLYFQPSQDKLPHVLLYAVFAPIFVMGILRGDFSPTVISLLQWYIPLGAGLIYIIPGDFTQHYSSATTDS